jgi:hypothetical protein
VTGLSSGSPASRGSGATGSHANHGGCCTAGGDGSSTTNVVTLSDAVERFTARVAHRLVTRP